jgi:hypothetical protein
MQGAYVESFNNKLAEFVKDLGVAFPDIPDINTLRSSLVLARSLDPSLPQKLFHHHVALPFGDRILASDEGFFMQYDYQELSKIHGVEIDIVGKIKNIWHDLTDNNKDAIWKYLHVLVVLSRKCGVPA